MKSLSSLMAMVLALIAFPAHAEDSSARATLNNTIDEQSSGIIIRVAIDEEGQEHTEYAEIRLAPAGDSANSLDDVSTMWQEATPIDANPNLTISFDEDADSSTRWHRHRRGVFAPGFYFHARPTFYFNWHSPVRFGRPHYWSSHRHYPRSPFFGYRYYYYPRMVW